MCNYSARKGFTLVEVLITLGIIGIVSALTIPTLVTTYEKEQTAAKLKQCYSIIQQAFLFAYAENGGIDQFKFVKQDGITEDFTQINNSLAEFANKYFIPYIKTAEVCETGNNKCSYNWFGFDGHQYDFPVDKNNFAFLMNNSALVRLRYNNGSGAYGNEILLYLDINGKNKPNVIGKDIFIMKVSSDSRNIDFIGSVLERTVLRDHNAMGCATRQLSGGYYCGALIKYDGWKIEKDYPW